jgi:hypothetical protein
MARMIEMDALDALPSRMTLRVGDVLRLGASGAHVVSGAETLEVLGPLVPGVPVGHAEILSPEGAPGLVLVVARRTGRATLELVLGSPWANVKTARIELNVLGE